MRTVLFALIMVVSLNAFGQDKITIPVIGEVPFVKKGDLYTLDLGKLGKFGFEGSIDPLSLSATVGIDDLKAFPGASAMALLGLQDITMTVTKKEFEIAANIDDKFKDDIVDEVKKIDIIAPVVEAVLNTLEIRESQASLTFNTNMQLVGKLDINIFVFGKKLPIPDFEGVLDAKKIFNTVVSAIKDVATDELAKVGKVVADAVVESGKAIAGAFNDAMEIAKTASKHVTHSKSECDKKCVPDHARKLSMPMLRASNLALYTFYDRTMPVLVNIRGKNPQQTEQLRKQYMLSQWNQLIAKIDSDWSKIRGDKSYVRFYIQPSSATNGGHIFRAKIDEYKQKHIDARNNVWYQLMTDTKFLGPIDNYSPEISYNAHLHLRNSWKKTFIHIEHGKPECGEIGPGWASAKWVFEKVDKNVVRIKNVYKGTYLNIETGNVQSSAISSGAHSAMWIIEAIPGSNAVRIKSKWKPTKYLHIERGALECTEINYAWLSARWDLGYIRYQELPKIEVAKIQFNKHSRLNNAWKNTYVNIEYGNPQCGAVGPGWLSAKWNLSEHRKRFC